MFFVLTLADEGKQVRSTMLFLLNAVDLRCIPSRLLNTGAH